MENKITALIIDASTGEVTEEELTFEQITERESLLAETTLAREEAEAKAEARTSALAKLAALGLTEEEVAAL